MVDTINVRDLDPAPEIVDVIVLDAAGKPRRAAAQDSLEVPDTVHVTEADGTAGSRTRKELAAEQAGEVAGYSNGKLACRFATTANIALATAFEAGDIIDGVTLIAGDRGLVKNQTTGSQNGIYIVQATGAAVRATDADTGAEILNALVAVHSGTTNAETAWALTTAGPITIGTTALTFEQQVPGVGGGGGFIAANTTEVLGGTENTKGVTAASLAATWVKGTSLASASTVSIGEGGLFHVTGSANINDFDFGVDASGRHVALVFDGACLLTNNASTMVLNNAGGNITTAINDVLFLWSEGSDAVRGFLLRSSGLPLNAALVDLASRWIAASASGPATFDFYEDTDNGTNRVRLAAPALLSADYSMVLPNYALDLNAVENQWWLPASIWRPQLTLGAEPVTLETTTNKNTFDFFNFDNAINEYIQLGIVFPLRWNAGTIFGQVYWRHPTTTTNFATIWGLQGTAIGDGVDMDAAWGTAIEVTDTGGSNGFNYIAPAFAVTTIASAGDGKLNNLRLYRNAAAGGDTLAVDARFGGLLLNYVADQIKDA